MKMQDMTRRDYFAAAAISGMLTNEDLLKAHLIATHEDHPDAIEIAVDIAIRLEQELDKRENEG